ncbi:MAG TPA: hypothetical protein VIJ14_04295 [Rhabdochlamydiaceae bacterium]
MKKFVSLLTCAAFLFSSVRADEAPPLPPVDNQAMTSDQDNGTPPAETLATSPELSDDNTAAPTNDGKKHVGEAANDGSKAAGSGAGKYVLAACAIAVGIAALILVARHSGHKK